LHSAPISSQSLRSVASRSLAWTAAGKYLNAVLGLAVGAVLARVLEPRDFGLTALVGVLSGFLAVIADAGVSTTIVQKRDLPPEGVSSLFWTSVGLGAAMSALMLVVAPLMARFSGEPRLELITAVLGIGFLSTSIGKVPSGLLLRAMNFRAVAMSDLTAALVAGAVGITAALLGAGYWALVAQSLTNGFLNAIMRLAFARFVPELTFRWDLVRSASRYSTGILAF
jgi:PST family polysaccharide transporter